MNFFEKYKFGSIVIGLLLVLNLTSLYFIFVHHQALFNKTETTEEHRSGRRDGHSRHPSNYIARELGLDEAQRKELKTMQKELRIRTHDLRKEMKDLRHDLFHEFDLDSNSVAQKVEEIGLKHGELERTMYDHFAAIRNMCNERQKEKYDQIIQRVVERFNPQRSHPKHRGKRRPRRQRPE